jgi:dimethylamine--corrinoid protein Co-methyltransferase
VGIGDPLGMGCTHALASGMGGMRAAGDLVARMQMARGMRLDQAKRHVAAKLGVGERDLSDPTVMWEVRRQLGLGRFDDQDTTFPEEAAAMAAKFRIAELLDVPVNCVTQFAQQAGLD